MGSIRVSDIAQLASSSVEDPEGTLREALAIDSQGMMATRSWLLGALVAVPVAVMSAYFADTSKLPGWSLYVLGAFVVLFGGLFVWHASQVRAAARSHIYACILLRELQGVAPLIRQFEKAQVDDE